MTTRRLIMTAAEVRATLRGDKAQFRRVARIPWLPGANPHFSQASAFHNGRKWRIAGSEEMTTGFYCPFGAVGDRLWVPETMRKSGEFMAYSADGALFEAEPGMHWPSIIEDRHVLSSTIMPQWASRITLEITSVRVQRLQDISEEDARAEGITDGGCLNCGKSEPCGCSEPMPCAIEGFVYLWDSTNAKRAPWSSNPWVWAITYKRIAP